MESIRKKKKTFPQVAIVKPHIALNVKKCRKRPSFIKNVWH